MHPFQRFLLLSLLLSQLWLPLSLRAEADHGHDHAGEAHGLTLTAEQLEAHGIALATVGPAELRRTRVFPGELRLDETRVAQVTPRVAGTLLAVQVAEGDTVRRGDVLARLSSREAAEAIMAARAARLRARRARTLAQDEAALAERRATSAREAREAALAADEADLEAAAAELRLEALGLDLETGTPSERVLLAPMDGVVLTRQATVGEAVAGETTLFTVANLAAVWAEVQVEPAQAKAIRPGQKLALRPSGAEGTVRWVGATVEADTRTVRVRAEVPNPSGALRPGDFTEGTLEEAAERVALAVGNGAILRGADGDPVVFVRHGEAFEPREVRLGRRDATYTEVLEGLAAGDVYVAKGAFTLMAEASKASFGDGHNH